ncbi:hypothetical protein L1887_16953 [Cichorium endivia]|nr:hypothetical protein L1887_16953 [Cichorium endivia]
MDFEPNSTSPKLLLFSQGFNRLEMEGGFTPPPHYKATIPFQWEEAPGKPRSTTVTANDPPPQAAKSLVLPPRMLINSATTTPTNGKAKVEMMRSPTSVLEGPYSGKSKWKMMMPLKKMIMCKDTSSHQFSSWSWDSITDTRRSSSSSFDDLSNSLDSMSKINKVSKRHSLIFFNKNTCSIMEGMNQSINQAVPWRR